VSLARIGDVIMNIIPQVLHRGARPIGYAEFYDALQATCTRRFPWTRGTNDRAVGRRITS